MKQLNEALTLRMSGGGAMTEESKRTLARTREELTRYADAVNERRPDLALSMHAVIGRIAALEKLSHQPVDAAADWVGLKASGLDEILDTAERLGNAWRPVGEGSDFLWRDLATSKHSGAQMDQARTATAEAAHAAQALAERCRAVDSDLGTAWGVDLAHARRRLRLLELLESRPTSPVTWLTLGDTAVLQRRAEQLAGAVRKHEEATGVLEGLLGAARVSDVDPDLCADVAGPLDVTPWSPSGDTSSTQLHEAVDMLVSTPTVLADVLRDAKQLGSMLGVPADRINLRRAVELGHLAALGGSASLPERSWLNPAVQAALDESLRVLGPVVQLVNERRTVIEQVFRPEALEADLQGLEVRFRETHTGLRSLGSAARADRKLLKSLTVNGKADKAVRARLAEAVAWQKAEEALVASERQHAGGLGSYYERTATDFGRLSAAIDTARRAIELAGNDLNSGPMADQLGRDGQSDPRLTVVAQHLLETTRAWSGHARATLGEHAAAELELLPLDVAATVAATNATGLAGLVGAMDHVAAAAGGPVTLAQARAVHGSAVRLNQALVAVYDDYEGDRVLLGELYTGLTTDWPTLTSALDWLTDVRSMLDAPALPSQAERMCQPVVLSAEVRARIDQYSAARDAVAALFSRSRASTFVGDLDSDVREAADLLHEMQLSLRHRHHRVGRLRDGRRGARGAGSRQHPRAPGEDTSRRRGRPPQRRVGCSASVRRGHRRGRPPAPGQSLSGP